MTRPNRYPQELRERAVRMVVEHRGEHPSEWAAMGSIASKFGMTPDAAHLGAPGGGRWRDAPRVTSEEKERIRQLERGNRELRRGNEILPAHLHPAQP